MPTSPSPSPSRPLPLHLLTAVVPARDLSDRLHGLLQGQGEILAGASELPAGRGITVRVVGPRVEPVAAALQAVLTTARATLLGIVEARAADLTMHPARTAPR